MKIWWQSSTPIHRLHDYRNTLTAHLDSIKRPDTEIYINGVDNGSMDLHYNAIVAMNSFAPGGVLNKMIQAGEKGYDAIAIGCFLDPAMQEAREVVPIPVFGLGETSMLAACMYGHKFSGVAFHAKQSQYYDRKAFEYGLGSRHIPFGDLGIDFNEVQNAFSSPGEMRERFISEARRLAAQGAEVILAACATVNAIIRREESQRSRRCPYPRLQRRSAQNDRGDGGAQPQHRLGRQPTPALPTTAARCACRLEAHLQFPCRTATQRLTAYNRSADEDRIQIGFR